MTEWIWISIIVGLINFTNVRFGLFFFGEPLVIGMLTGWYVQDIALGLYIGAVMQFMWIKSIPIGVKVQVNYSIMTFLSIVFIQAYGESLFPIVFFCAYVFSLIGKFLEIVMKRLCNVFVGDMMKNIEKVRFLTVHFLFLLFHVLSFSLLAFVGLFASDMALNFVGPLLSEKMKDAFGFTYPFLALYALAMFFHSVEFNLKYLYLLIGIILGLAMMFLNLGFEVKISVLVIGAIGITLLQQRIYRSKKALL